MTPAYYEEQALNPYSCPSSAHLRSQNGNVSKSESTIHVTNIHYITADVLYEASHYLSQSVLRGGKTYLFK